MTPPRVAPAQALDFPDVPDDAPAKPPRVWPRQKFTPGKLCPCAACKDAEAKLLARAAQLERIDAALRGAR